MIYLKNEEEIAIMHQGGMILHQVFDNIEQWLKPGITTIELDKKITDFILSCGGLPSFKTVDNYNYTCCISVNDQVVHTPPSDRVLKKGDVVTVDVGVLYNAYHTDKAYSYQLEDNNANINNFLETGKKTLKQAISQAKEGNYLYDISYMIETGICQSGYKVVKELTGHGIGKALHEDPMVPGYCYKKRKKTPQLTEGMTLAIEVIYSQSSQAVKSEKGSDWSLITVDGSIAACFEETIAINKNSPLILT